MRVRAKILRPLLGILLIAVAIAVFVWWESTGREALTMESVMVTNKTIQGGQVVKGKDFKEIRLAKETIIKGAITSERVEEIKGYIANQYIPKGAQVTRNMLIRADKVLKPNQFLFSIKEEWIDSRSSSLRKDDVIDIFDHTGSLHLGTFQVAYVKDANEQEVVGTEQNLNEELLQRDFSSSTIAHVEIISTLEDYTRIQQMAELQQVKFLLVQKGGNKNE